MRTLRLVVLWLAFLCGIAPQSLAAVVLPKRPIPAVEHVVIVIVEAAP